MEDTARHATLSDMVALLRDQRARSLDVVAPATALHSRKGLFQLTGMDGVAADGTLLEADGKYRPTAVFDEGLANKLGIPLAYVRRLRGDGMADLMDANVNGLLHGRRLISGTSVGEYTRQPDARSFTLRLFRGADGSTGVARALLSNGYKIINNLDVVMATLSGIRAAGLDTSDMIHSLDLTDRRIYMRVIAPQVQAYAPELLRGYRSPFSGASGADNPTVFAGFVVSNSETGDGSLTIAPRLTVQVCNNGMTISKDAFKRVHLGSRQEDGVVDWSLDTQRKELDLISARARDMVKTCLDVDYVNRVIREATERAGKPVDKPTDVIKVVGKALAWSEADQDEILSHFIKGGQTTAGGLMQAATSYAQTVGDADRAAAIEGSAMRVLELA